MDSIYFCSSEKNLNVLRRLFHYLKTFQHFQYRPLYNLIGLEILIERHPRFFVPAAVDDLFVRRTDTAVADRGNTSAEATALALERLNRVSFESAFPCRELTRFARFFNVELFIIAKKFLFPAGEMKRHISASADEARDGQLMVTLAAFGIQLLKRASLNAFYFSSRRAVWDEKGIECVIDLIPQLAVIVLYPESGNESHLPEILVFGELFP
jgi:hypothetical protein